MEAVMNEVSRIACDKDEMDGIWLVIVPKLLVYDILLRPKKRSPASKSRIPDWMIFNHYCYGM